uniref:Uncharacterized protein n=1 Tax=Anguilla anguilla TaxID=7936 RepID=A0A0E9PJ53_ANGAN
MIEIHNINQKQLNFECIDLHFIRYLIYSVMM